MTSTPQSNRNQRRYASHRPRAHQRGFTLVELMISLLIGLFLLMGALTVYQTSRSNYRVSDAYARLQENVRFAFDMIEPDVRLAGFWGRHGEPGLVDTDFPATVVIRCDTLDTSALMLPATDYTSWSLNFMAPVQAVDETSGYGHNVMGIPCSPARQAQRQSDALVLRHASGQPFAPTNNVIQVQTDINRAEVFNDGIVPPGYDPLSQTHNIITNVYYVDTGSDLDPDLPSLRMKTLVPGGTHEDREIIPGVENMQVQLGLDTNGDSLVDRYVDPDHDTVNPTTAGTIANARVVAVHLWLLIRSERPEVGFTDDKTYLTPDPDFEVLPCAGANCEYPADHRRLAVSKTILLRNVR